MTRLISILCLTALLTSWAATCPAFDYLENQDMLSDVARFPSFELVDLEGRPVKSAEILGDRALLVVFWSMYCYACVKKFDALVEIRQKYPPESLEIVSVNTDGEFGVPEEMVTKFITGLEQRQGIKVNFPVVYKGGDQLARKLGIVFLPAIVAVGADGVVAGTYRRFTEESNEEISSGIEKIIPASAREGLK